MIPKKIHYCWFGPKPMPKLVRKCIATWNEHLPDYELCLWNESNSPMNVPFVQQAYETKKYAFVADYVRFWALHNHGGIYLDTDMYVIKSLDPLLNYDCFFGYETGKRNVISCGIIGCEKQNAIILCILDKYHTLTFDANNLSDFIVPRLITPLVKDDATLLPYDFFYPLPYEERFSPKWGKYVSHNTFAVHLWNVSWKSKMSNILTFISHCRKNIRFKL